MSGRGGGEPDDPLASGATSALMSSAAAAAAAARPASAAVGSGAALSSSSRQLAGGGGSTGGVRGWHAVQMHVGGTVTHIAPEAFKKGARIDASVDVFAFGIIMVRARGGEALAVAAVQLEGIGAPPGVYWSVRS
ncbi:hypothetical protein CHLRE_01g055477v5 [Chlamydomonas reinhardtii]|uniref:Protein kinase domain-containing protein n=1 Tax=Chlamydomonas reinhardtii TaxID=3055 RepID=A0A2K3E8E3_CHLRE|nr:uncharacterized protein CHLRE_01g055477v5 [Chlamydomonas reinhardtii]PNW89049.1 hypothetical protein CHLRE_01g055477v5 [Chlamydomonas reinhardtii]